jgi:hypothetical protein
LIVQKILTESLDRRDADFLKRRPYLGELHKKRIECATRLPKLVSLFTEFCEQNTPRRETCSQVIHFSRK